MQDLFCIYLFVFLEIDHSQFHFSVSIIAADNYVSQFSNGGAGGRFWKDNCSNRHFIVAERNEHRSPPAYATADLYTGGCKSRYTAVSHQKNW